MVYRSLIVSEKVQQRRRGLLLRPLIPTSHGLTNSLFVSAGRRVEEEDKSITDTLAAILNQVPVASDVTKQEKSPSDVRQKAKRVTSAGAKRQRQKENEYYTGLRSARRNPDVQKILRTRNLQVDDHFWKKYGQKNIHGAIHPRSYFKCMQSQDQGCEARKQVQRLDEDSSTFLVTYIGKHTCQRIIYTSQPLYDDAVVGKNSFMISFNSNSNPKSLSSSVEACTKQSHELKGPDCDWGFYESLGCKRAKEEEVITPETPRSVITSTKSPEVDSSDFDFDMSDETKMLVENIWSELVVHSCV